MDGNARAYASWLLNAVNAAKFTHPGNHGEVQ